jgi:Na+-transporting NADH:ubiquinone oxidoreductase subunit NqrD
LLDAIVTLGGILYGAVLVSVAFFRNRFTEAVRIDALIVPKPTDATRMLNPGIGLLLVAYSTYSLLR